MLDVALCDETGRAQPQGLRRPPKELPMPRYLVERHFPDGLVIPTTDDGAAACLSVVARNGEAAVTWVHSYVSLDKRTSYCVYDGPDADAIVTAAASNGLPVERVVEVRVLDPYFYH
jgi:hypothetical protein